MKQPLDGAHVAHELFFAVCFDEFDDYLIAAFQTRAVHLPDRCRCEGVVFNGIEAGSEIVISILVQQAVHVFRGDFNRVAVQACQVLAFLAVEKINAQGKHLRDFDGEQALVLNFLQVGQFAAVEGTHQPDKSDPVHGFSL